MWEARARQAATPQTDAPSAWEARTGQDATPQAEAPSVWEALTRWATTRRCALGIRDELTRRAALQQTDALRVWEALTRWAATLRDVEVASVAGPKGAATDRSLRSE